MRQFVEHSEINILMPTIDDYLKYKG